MTARKPSLNPSLFKGLIADDPAPARRIEAAIDDAQRVATRPNHVQSPPPAEGSAASPARVLRRRYQRLHLYATHDMLRLVRVMQAEALASNLPMGQRGPSVIMAAALDRFAELASEDRLEAIRNRLGPR